MIAFADYFSSSFRFLDAFETQNEIRSSKNKERSTDIEAKVNKEVEKKVN